MNSMQLLAEAQFHGAKRLASSKFRFYWALALLVLLWCSLSVLTVAINRFFENPTFVAQGDNVESMKPFPTVAVCPPVEFPQYKIDAFVNNLKYPPGINASNIVEGIPEIGEHLKVSEHKYPPGINASNIVEGIPQIGAFFSPDVSYVLRDLERIQYVLDYNDMDIETAGQHLTLSCSETVIRCRWLNKFLNCSNAFELQLTNYGFCCVFNGNSLKREINTFGLHRIRPKRNLFVSSVGFSNSLMIAVNQSHTSLGSLDLSYKWLVLQGAQYTDSIYNGTPISPAVETWAGYDTTLLQVTDETQKLGVELRRCRMAEDRLKYFPHYHKHYCLFECEMERIQKRCNCVEVVHPYQNGVPVCGTKHISCVRQTAVTFGGDDNCHCPPSCDTETETTSVIDHELVKNSHEYDEFYAGLDFDNVTIIRAYILQHHSYIFTRRSYFNTMHLFSQLGGVFNVFFGCSVLSLLELLQLTWRAICDFYFQRQAVKKELEMKREINTPNKNET